MMRPAASQPGAAAAQHQQLPQLHGGRTASGAVPGTRRGSGGALPLTSISRRWVPSSSLLTWSTVVFGFLVVFWRWAETEGPDSPGPGSGGIPLPERTHDGTFVVRVFQTVPTEDYASDPKLRKSLNAMRAMIAAWDPSASQEEDESSSSSFRLEYRLYTPSNRRNFLRLYGSYCYSGSASAASTDDSKSSGHSLKGKSRKRRRQRARKDEEAKKNVVLDRYDRLPTEALQVELWKYCMFVTGHGTAYVHHDVVLMRTFANSFLESKFGDEDVEGEGGDMDGSPGELHLRNFALLVKNGGMDDQHFVDREMDDEEDPQKSLTAPSLLSSSSFRRNLRPTAPVVVAHPSFLILTQPSATTIGTGMMDVLVETSNQVLVSSPLLLPRELHRLIRMDMEQDRRVEKSEDGAPAAGTAPGAGGATTSSSTSESSTATEKRVVTPHWVLLESRCTYLADPSSSSGDIWKNVHVSSSSSASSSEVQEQLHRMGGQTSAQQQHVFLHPQVDSSSSLIHTSETPDANSRRVRHYCPLSHNGYCCQVYDPRRLYDGSTSTSRAVKDKKDDADNAAAASVERKVQARLQASDVIMMMRHPIADSHRKMGDEDNSGEDDEDVPKEEQWFAPRLPKIHPHPMPYLYHVEALELQEAGKEEFVNGTTGDSSSSIVDKTLTTHINSKYNTSYHVESLEIPYMSSVREKPLLTLKHRLGSDGETASGQQSPTPNFFDILLENDCLPTAKDCHRCLKRVRDGVGSDCHKCAAECGCYCSVLCKIRPPTKTVVKEFHIYPPRYRKDVSRLVPRIIHQTWFEIVTKEKYPNMSRLIESWKQSGWEYNFYDDDSAAEFLSTHFPSEVREAYDAIIPGAFKADLFRYCVLLIRGGVYADMDVLLEANLDAVVANDVGFMTPIDEPGIKVGRRSCLWNGLIAVAPGHPFLAKTIEIVVNNIRNRFTSVDYDDMLCPDPVLHVSHSVDTLFTCGPCILGGSINTVLGRHMQDEFEIGDVDIWQTERLAQGKTHKNATTSGSGGGGGGIVVRPDDARLLIPGRTIILAQNKEDMGAHRFTWVERNVMVAATDMPDYDDRPPTMEHYSKTHGKFGVYGVKKLYRDNVSADEKIRVVVKEV